MISPWISLPFCLCPKDPQQASSRGAFCWVGFSFQHFADQSKDAPEKAVLSSSQYEPCNCPGPSCMQATQFLLSSRPKWVCFWSRIIKSKPCCLLKQGLRWRGPVQQQDVLALVRPGRKQNTEPNAHYVCGGAPVWHPSELCLEQRYIHVSKVRANNFWNAPNLGLASLKHRQGELPLEKEPSHKFIAGADLPGNLP